MRKYYFITASKFKCSSAWLQRLTIFFLLLQFACIVAKIGIRQSNCEKKFAYHRK